MAPQNGKSAKQQTTNVLKRKPFHRLGARQQEKVSKKQAKTATLKEQPTDVIQARRRDRKARFKAKRKPCGPLTAEEAFDQDIWATYRLVQAECQPSKADLLAAAAESDKQVEIKAIYTAYNRVLNRVVRSGEFTSQDRDEHRSLIVRLQRLQRLQLHLYIDEKALAIPDTSSPGRENRRMEREREREPLSDHDMLLTWRVSSLMHVPRPTTLKWQRPTHILISARGFPAHRKAKKTKRLAISAALLPLVAIHSRSAEMLRSGVERSWLCVHVFCVISVHLATWYED